MSKEVVRGLKGLWDLLETEWVNTVKTTEIHWKGDDL